MLKIKIEGKELKEIIEKVLCNMDKRASFPLLTKVILIDNVDKLTAYTSDLEGYLQVSTNNYISLDSAGSIGIDEKDLKVLLKMTGDVTITETEDSIQVQNGKKNISLMKYDISEFPKIPEDDFIETLKYKESEFMETINNLVTFTSDNGNNKVMQCIHFNLSDSRIETLDSYRIGMKAIQDSEKLINEGKILVMNSIVSDLKKVLDKKSESEVILSQGSKYIKVNSSNFEYIQRRVDGEYYKVSQMLIDNFKLSFKVNVEEMLSHVRYYTENVRSKADKEPIVFKIEDETLISYARNARFEVSDSMEIKEHSGEDLLIGFNPFFWVDALKIADNDTLEIGGVNCKSPFFIKASKYSFVILPINLNSQVNAMEKYLSKFVV